MSSSSSNSGDVFDLRKIRRLVELMKDHELNEIDLREGDMRLRLRRGGESAGSEGPSLPQSPASNPPAASTTPETSASAAKDDNQEHIHVITSPMVGTFYRSSSPDTPPFVNVGDHIGPDTTVCLVEAMKVFNEIPAGISGKVIAILVENEEPTEFGQPLFKIDTRQ